MITTTYRRLLSAGRSSKWEFWLYVDGLTPRGIRARANLRALCKERLAGMCRIRVVDARKHPQLARADQVVALPTLIRKAPKPIRAAIGDLSNSAKALVGIGL